jgi:type II secretory pathway pseudopilin PulG
MVKPRPYGFFTIDALIGLFIIAALASALAVAMGRQRQSVTRFGDSRAAVHLAERALLNLQRGRPLPPVDDQTAISVKNLDTPGTGSQVWVEVSATVRGRTQNLIGLVPAAEARP